MPTRKHYLYRDRDGRTLVDDHAYITMRAEVWASRSRPSILSDLSPVLRDIFAPPLTAPRRRRGRFQDGLTLPDGYRAGFPLLLEMAAGMRLPSTVRMFRVPKHRARRKNPVHQIRGAESIG